MIKKSTVIIKATAPIKFLISSFKINDQFLKEIKPNLSMKTIANSLINKQVYYFSENEQAKLLDEVQAKVFQVLRSAAKCKQDKLGRQATFEELGFDSLDTVQLVVAMQEYFGFDIPNQEAQKINTVQAAINTFYRHLNAKQNPSSSS